MKKTAGMLLILSCVFSLAQEARVIPVVFSADVEEALFPETTDYVEVAYFVTPGGEPVFEEVAEKVWRVQERRFLILGSTGEPLPGNLVRRAELFVQVYADGQPVWKAPRPLNPQREAVAISPSSGDALKSLKASLSRTVNLDANYLAECANYLVNNISSFDVSAISYSIEGYGEVINNAGTWTGEPIASGSVWQDDGDRVYLDNNYVEITGEGTNDALTLETTGTRPPWITFNPPNNSSSLGRIRFQDADGVIPYHYIEAGKFDWQVVGGASFTIHLPTLTVTDDFQTVMEVKSTDGNAYLALAVPENKHAMIEFDVVEPDQTVTPVGKIYYDTSDSTMMFSNDDGDNVVFENNVGIGTRTPKGKLDVDGSIYQRGGQIHAKRTLGKDANLESIAEHAQTMWSEQRLPAVPAPEILEDGREAVELGQQRRGMLEELEKAHIYIQQLHERIEKLDAQVRVLQREVKKVQ